MSRVLCRAVLGGRGTPVIALSAALIGVYAGYLLWYVAGYFPGSTSDCRLVAAVLVVWASAFVAVYQIPDQLFANRRVGDVLRLPLPAERLVLLIVVRLACIQLGISACGLWAFAAFSGGDRLAALATLLFCWVLACLIDLLVLIAATAAARLLPAPAVGYGLILFQYGMFLLLALSGGDLAAKALLVPGYLQALARAFRPGCWLPGAALLALPLAACSRLIVRAGYVRGYLNAQGFQRAGRIRGSSVVSRIPNPYLMLEWARVARSKELVFFSNVKNVLTVAVLAGLLTRGFGGAGAAGQYAAGMFALASCGAVNTISSTAYSSDPNRPYYPFLPLSARRLFFWKTVTGFLWGELTVLLIWAGAALILALPAPAALLLLGFGTVTNYACSWLGVFLDRAMPRSPKSTNELLHGNLSKVLVLAATVALTVWEIDMAPRLPDVSMLPLLATCMNACVVVLELICGRFVGGMQCD